MNQIYKIKNKKTQKFTKINIIYNKSKKGLGNGPINKERARANKKNNKAKVNFNKTLTVLRMILNKGH
jgi:hypothetical protein